MRRKRTAAWVLLGATLAIVAAVGCKKDGSGTPEPGPSSTPAGPTARTAAPEAEGSPAVPAPTEATGAAAIVDRAIEAAGGLETLRERLSALSTRTKGVYLGMPFEMRSSWRAPDGLVMELQGRTLKMGYVGDECWTLDGDVVVDCGPEERGSSEETRRVAHLMNLYPLKEPGVVLSPAGEEEVEGEPTVAVRVSGDQAPSVLTFYFSKRSHLPLRVRYDGDMMGQKQPMEITVSDYRSIDGVQVPRRSRMTAGGRLVIEESVLEISFGDAADVTFHRPPQAALGQSRTRTFEACQAVSTTVTGPYEGIGAAMGRVFAWMQPHGLIPAGSPMFVYLKGPGTAATPADYVTEIHVPVFLPGEKPPPSDGVALRELPAREVAARLEKGPYDQVGPAYGALAQWAATNGYTIVGPPGMTSYGEPRTTPPTELLQELWFPVRKN